MTQDKREAPDATSQDVGAFLNLEYQETHRYFLQIESTMHDVLKFYSVSLLALISVSVGLAEFVLGGDSEVPLYAILAGLWFVFTVVGLLELHYYVELRIRKIKMVEQLAAIRDHYLGSNDNLTRLLRLIPSVSESPPFLRRPSAEWYSVLYFCAANTGVLVFGLFSADKEWQFFPDPFGPSGSATALVLLAFGLVSFLYQFYSATASAFVEDLKREGEVGKSQYRLFPHDQVPHLFAPMNLAARAIESYVRRKRGRPSDNA